MDLSTNLYPLRDDDESELVVARPGQASRKGNKSLKLKTASLTWFLGCISRPGRLPDPYIISGNCRNTGYIEYRSAFAPLDGASGLY